MRKADVFASPQATGRFFASLAGLTAAIMEVTEKAIKDLEDAKRIRAMPGVRRVLTIGGTVLGTGAAWAFALLDGLKAGEYYQRGNIGMFSLYIASAGINIALGIAVFRIGLLALSGFVGVLILLALAVALLVSWFEESDVQRWLSHCHYGIDPRYPAMAESEKALRRALGGD